MFDPGHLHHLTQLTHSLPLHPPPPFRYKQSDGFDSMTPYYQYLIDGKYGLNILVYSGDDDDVAATVGSQEWIWDLGYQVSYLSWHKINFLLLRIWFSAKENERII